MANSEIELDAEMDDDEPKKKKQKVLQKYLPGYQITYPVIRRSSVKLADSISLAARKAYLAVIPGVPF